MTLAIGLSLIAVGTALLVVEVKASRKRHQLNAAIGVLTNPLTGSSRSHRSLAQGAALAGGASGISLYEIYAAADHHEAVLDVIEQRYPQVMGDAGPLEWSNKIESLFDTGPVSVQNYVNAYVGMASEDAAVQYWQSQGATAERFSNLNHPDNDIQLTMMDGSTVDTSVKSLGSVSEFRQVVTEHPDSTHYTVNSELYDKLAAKGMIAEYQDQGITVVSGGWSHEVLHESAAETFGDIHEAADVADNVPYVAMAFLGYKAVKNARAWWKGKQSGRELGVNVASDAARIAVAAATAMGGAELGAILGTMVAPGVGTIIGGGVGALIAWIVASRFIELIKEWWKWGKIIKAANHFGSKYASGLTPQMRTNLVDNLEFFSAIQRNEAEERSLAGRYSRQANPYLSDTVTLPAVLTKLHHQNLRTEVKNIHRVMKRGNSQILHLCSEAAAKVAGRRKGRKFRVTKRRFLGEIIVANHNRLGLVLDKQEYDLALERDRQYTISPNHPYRFKVDSKELLEGVLMKEWSDLPRKRKRFRFTTNPVMGIGITTCFIVGLLVAVFL